jgi:hypothetical protein
MRPYQILKKWKKYGGALYTARRRRCFPPPPAGKAPPVRRLKSRNTGCVRGWAVFLSRLSVVPLLEAAMRLYGEIGGQPPRPGTVGALGVGSVKVQDR